VLAVTSRAGLTIRGEVGLNVRRGPFSHTRTQDFLFRGALFFTLKVDDLFYSRQRMSTLAVDRGSPGGGGGPSNGTMDNPALITSFHFILHNTPLNTLSNTECIQKTDSFQIV